LNPEVLVGIEFWESSLPAGAHLALLLLIALIVVVRAPSLSSRAIFAAGMLVLLPIPIVLLMGPGESLLSGSEGVLEAITEGLLLCMVWRGSKERDLWLAIGAGVVFLEEIDYGQLWLSFATPDWLNSLSVRSSQANFHNIDGLDWIWRPLPMLAVLIFSRRPLSWKAIETFLTRVRLPVLDRRIVWGLLVAVAAIWPTMAMAGERRMNESLELALVALVFVAWQPGRNSGQQVPRSPGVFLGLPRETNSSEEKLSD
jgi:hypothetical protein